MDDLYAPEIQAMAPAAREALQNARLAEVADRAWELPIEFLRGRLEAAAIGPGELTLETLRSIDVVTKDALRTSERTHPPFGDYRGAPIAECVRVAQTTGTTGDPTVVFWTARDLAVEYDAYARNQWRQGFRPESTIVVTAHPGYLNGGEPLVRGAAEAFGALCVSIGPPVDDAGVAAALRICQLLRPNRYVLLPPAHLRLYEAALTAGLDPSADLGLPELDESVTFQWKQVSAGLDAFAYLGTECAEHAGAHVNEDYAVVEVLDPMTLEPVPAGTRGHLVITTIGRDNVVLRYDTEDLVRRADEACPCGETTMRLYWDGRDKDVVVVGTRAVLPIDVAIALASVPALATPVPVFQLVRTGPWHDRLGVRAEALPAADGAASRLEEALGLPVDLQLVAPGSLLRGGYKPAQVIDE